MSDRDSFMDEVADEIRRDRLYAALRRYGWIGVLVVLLIVGGAAWREYTRAQDTAAARAFGDAILSALEEETPAARADALAAIDAPTPEGRAIVAMMRAAEDTGSAEANAALETVTQDADLPEIYRQIAALKLLSQDDAGLDADTRRAGLSGLTVEGSAVRLLAEEQLALLDLEAGDMEAARERLQAIQMDPQATPDLRLRATRVIVALGPADAAAAPQDSGAAPDAVTPEQ